MIPIPPTAYAALGAVLVIGGLGVALKVQTARLDAAKAEYAAFVAQTKAIGEAAAKAAKEREDADRKRKEDADAQLSRSRRDLAALGDAYRSLRDARRNGGFLSAPAPGAADPGRACLERAELERTLERIDAVGAGIAQEGDQARIGLDSVKDWARK